MGFEELGYFGWNPDMIVRAMSSVPSSHSYQRASIYCMSRDSSSTLMTSPGLLYNLRGKAFSY